MMDILTDRQARQLLEQCPTGVLLVDGTGRICGFNAALDRLLDGRAAQLHGQDATGLAGGPFAGLLETADPVHVTTGDGGARVLEVSRLPLEGAADGAAEVRLYRDATREHRLAEERARLEDQLRAQAITDPVTGLLNRRGLMLALEPQVSRCRRYDNPLAVIMVDVPETADDDALRVDVSRLLKDQLRWADLVGTSEDHDFVIALPETGRDDALRLAEKLQARLESLRPDAPVTACYGVTQWQKSDSTAVLLGRAANALERARTTRTDSVVAL